MVGVWWVECFIVDCEGEVGGVFVVYFGRQLVNLGIYFIMYRKYFLL